MTQGLDKRMGWGGKKTAFPDSPMPYLHKKSPAVFRWTFFRLVAVEGFEWGNLSFFRMPRRILQSKSGIFGEKFNEDIRKKDFYPPKPSIATSLLWR